MVCAHYRGGFLDHYDRVRRASPRLALTNIGWISRHSPRFISPLIFPRETEFARIRTDYFRDEYSLSLSPSLFSSFLEKWKKKFFLLVAGIVSNAAAESFPLACVNK